MNSLKIKPKFAILFIVISTLSTITGGLAIRTSINSLLETTHSNLAVEFANIERDRIENAFNGDIKMSRLVASDRTLQRWVNDEDNIILRSDALSTLDSYAKHASSGRFFFIVDKSKNYYTNARGDEIVNAHYLYTVDTNDPSSSWYIDSMTQKDEYQLNLDADEVVGGSINIFINMPVKKNGKIIGLTGTSTPISQFIKNYAGNENIKSRNIIFDGDGKILIQHGRFYLDKDSAQKAKTEARGNFFDMLPEAYQQQNISEALKKLKRDPSSAISLRLSFDGYEWITGISYIEELDWFAAASVKAEESITADTIKVSFGVFIIVFLLTLIAVWVAIQRLIVSRVKALHHDTIGIYQLSDIDGISTAGDEILNLKIGFDKMQKKIDAHIDDLEATVVARTEELEAKNKKLSEVAVKDSLTSLYNRRGLLDRFRIEYIRSQRKEENIGVVILDIDNFKLLNDKYGHHIGDDAIEKIAKAINLRGEDIHARWGGEEFVIIAVNIDADSFPTLLNRILENVRNVEIESNSGVLHCTVSIGATILNPVPEKQYSDEDIREIMEEAIGLADRAMYAIKRSGKDNYKVIRSTSGD